MPSVPFREEVAVQICVEPRVCIPTYIEHYFRIFPFVAFHFGVLCLVHQQACFLLIGCYRCNIGHLDNAYPL